MDIHQIMENWKPGRFKAFVDSAIERFAETGADPGFEHFRELLFETAWAARRVADLDERLAARVYGLALEVPLEMLSIMKAK
jgi:hypothetical protein